MKPRTSPSSLLARFGLLLSLGLSLGLGSLQAESNGDAGRIANVEAQISTLDLVLQKAKNASEKTRLETKIQRLRDEITILRQRQLLDKRERALSDDRISNPLDALREKLRLVDASEEAGKKRIQALGDGRRTAAADRDLLIAQMEALRREAATKGIEVSTTELEERLFTRNEEIRSLSLQREAAENEVELAHEAERLREEIKVLENLPHSNIKALLDARDARDNAARKEASLGIHLAEQQQGLQMGESGLQLARQKLAMFDEELALLEKQTGFFKSDARVEKLLVQQRNQKKVVSERIPHLEAQVSAAQHARKLLAQQLDLLTTEHALREQRFDQLSSAYVERLRWPVYGLAALFAVYLIINYGLVRLVVRRSSRPITRRLVRYASVFGAAALVAGFLFDDLTMFAATLGIVSAALVISLQDVCTSVFGWLVIMIAGKFRVGDRLEIGSTRGDIIDIDMLSTTLNEINGWLGTDEPTGRVVVIPNNFIFKSNVINFNHQHPYIWSRLDFTLSFESPLPRSLELFGEVLRQTTQADFDAARRASAEFRERYGAEDAHYEPRIHTTIVDTGVTLSLYYVAHYKESCAARTCINEGLLRVQNENPAIQFSNPTINLVHTNPPPAVLPPPLREGAVARNRHANGGLSPVVIPNS